MNWMQLGGSLVAIMALAWVARLLRLGESRIADAATAQRMAEEALAGFIAHDALVASDGNAALVAGNGAVAVIKRHGAQVAVRRPIPPLHVREAVEGASIDTGERMFGSVTLLGVLAREIATLEAGVARVYRVMQ